MNERSREIVENIFRGIDVDGVEEGININRGDFEELYQEGFKDGKKAALSWGDIESAPKDGTEIFLLERGDRFPTVGFRIDGIWQAVESGLWLRPNWWLPLSALPPAREVKDVE